MKMRLYRLNTRENLLLAILVLFITAVAIINPRYIMVRNLVVIGDAAVLVGILAIAEMLVIIGGGIDISIGAILGTVSIITGVALNLWKFPVPIALIFGLLLGTLMGTANGALISYVRVPPIIATLAAIRIYRGILQLFVQGSNPDGSVAFLPLLAYGRIGPVPLNVIIFGAVAVLVALFLAYTRLGRMIYAVGGNEAAATTAGVKVKRVKLFTYAACGLLCAVAGLLHSARATYTNRSTGVGLEFTAIAAVAIGGVILSGGAGKVRGTVIGTLLLFALYNALIFAQIPAAWQYAFTGAMILFAVSMDGFFRREAE